MQKRHTINFAPEFAEDVEAGRKRQTVRKNRKRPISPGDILKLYTGMRTKHCRVLREAECTAVEQIAIGPGTVKINDTVLGPKATESFAKRDGFFDAKAMFAWFARRYPGVTTLRGQLIQWEAEDGARKSV